MALDIEGDLDIFLNPGEHGRVATIDPDGSPWEVNVIFETAEYEVDGHGPANINASKPTMVGKTSDVASLPVNTKVRIKGVNYLLKSPGPDEDGFTKWELKKA